MKMNEQLEESLLSYGVPGHLHEGLNLWLKVGIHPGSFLMAVLKNDLVGSVAWCDPEHLGSLPAIVMALQSGLPSAAWGSCDNVATWVEQGGLKGI